MIQQSPPRDPVLRRGCLPAKPVLIPASTLPPNSSRTDSGTSVFKTLDPSSTYLILNPPLINPKNKKEEEMGKSHLPTPLLDLT